MTYYYYYNFFLQPNDITFSCSNTITPHPLQLRMLLSNTHHYHTRLISYLYFVLIRTKTTLHHTTIIHFLPSLYAHLHLLRTFSIHFFYTTFSLLSTTFPSFNSFYHLLSTSFPWCTPRTSFQNMLLISPPSTSSAFSYLVLYKYHQYINDWA